LRFENSDSILQLSEKGRTGTKERQKRTEEEPIHHSWIGWRFKPWSMTEHIFNDPGTAVGER
jgi:hypothetical protein